MQIIMVQNVRIVPAITQNGIVQTTSVHVRNQRENGMERPVFVKQGIMAIIVPIVREIIQNGIRQQIAVPVH